jgi:hypothetical protein
MSRDDSSIDKAAEGFASAYLLSLILIPLLLLGVVLLVVFALGGSSSRPTTRPSGPVQTNESGLETARQSLTRQTDLNACHHALQQINSELGEKPALHPPSLTNDQQTWLRDHLSLSDEELKEIESNHYTQLDNHHLFRSLLMRDVASALKIRGVRGKAGGANVREKPLDEAARAFAWVMREVRLRQRAGEDAPPSEEAPPSFVVRRGWGTGLERALVFLALLEQLGDPDAPQPELLGFLLQIPKDEGAMRLWACGVMVGDGKDVYLFDPHLGLPLPGPKGQGIATLAQVREQPDVLAQLNVGEKLHYPVTAEQARSVQAQLVVPLSALSPRLRYLQEKLLAPTVRVRLAADAAADRERVKAAVSAGAGKPSPVIVSRDYCTLLRRFLPADEGGVDNALRLARFSIDLVPWQALPPILRDERVIPQSSELGMRMRNGFAAFFYTPTMDPGKPRDQLLRGRYSSAVPALVSERDNWNSQLVQRANAEDLEKKVGEWLNQATAVYARRYRAKGAPEVQEAEQQIKALWDQRTSLPIAIVLGSAAGSARNPEVAYQLGLCSHEQAEQLQARLDLENRIGTSPHPRDVEKAKSDWQNALNAWKRFEEDYPTHPDVAAARRLRGRAEAMLGDSAAAIASWKNVSNCPIEMEKIASLYLAQQGEKNNSPKAREDDKR